MVNDIEISNRLKGQRNNAQGRFFEHCIEAACETYRINNVAEIVKVPEPFRVMKKEKGGRFRGQFTKKAEPDFHGTLKNGKSIIFEAKYTLSDKLKKSVLTETQAQKLKKHNELGAVAGVCCGIQEKYYFIPWGVWENMKNIFGREYIKQEDVAQYEVKFDGSIRFLDYKHKER